jgi:ATP-dependent Clp protease ATP-binding subunit ClpA
VKNLLPARKKKTALNPRGARMAAELAERVIGQPESLDAIIPYIQMYQAGLSPEGRPIGVFLLLGPTGTGKTRTVEALAEVLHGSAKNVLRVDCGEYQMEHEVAKLIGAPPGYLGHRETQPMLTQVKLNAVMSEQNNLSIVLFDEIEKAAGSLQRLLLGVLDKATLRLGDNSTVNFERSLIFLTSNLGAREMARELRPEFGLETATVRPAASAAVAAIDGGRSAAKRLETVAVAAVKRKFSPEFINRIDLMLTYQSLDAAALDKILDLQVRSLQEHLDRRLGERSFQVEVPKRTRQFLLRHGTSVEYGARELKRTMHRFVMQPLAALVAEGRVAPRTVVRFEPNAAGERLDVLPGRLAA